MAPQRSSTCPGGLVESGPDPVQHRRCPGLRRCPGHRGRPGHRGPSRPASRSRWAAAASSAVYAAAPARSAAATRRRGCPLPSDQQHDGPAPQRLVRSRDLPAREGEGARPQHQVGRGRGGGPQVGRRVVPSHGVGLQGLQRRGDVRPPRPVARHVPPRTPRSRPAPGRRRRTLRRRRAHAPRASAAPHRSAAIPVHIGCPCASCLRSVPPRGSTGPDGRAGAAVVGAVRPEPVALAPPSRDAAFRRSHRPAMRPSAMPPSAMPPSDHGRQDRPADGGVHRPTMIDGDRCCGLPGGYRSATIRRPVRSGGGSDRPRCARSARRAGAVTPTHDIGRRR